MDTKSAKASISQVRDWTVAPEDRGQTVERAYGADWESGIIWRRTTDRSDQKVTYEHVEADAFRGDWAPWSAAPKIRGSWSKMGEVQ